MPRVSWAKAYVDLRHHPDLFGRPDSDFRLWVCLLLHAKEHCPDGVVRGLSPNDMRGMFGIKGSVKAVCAALAHFIAIGWTEVVDGGFRIIKFVERQRAAGDTPEAHAARTREYRKRIGGDVTHKRDVTSRDGARDGPRSDAEADSESDTEQKKKKGLEAVASAPPAPPPEITPDLLEGWPAPLLAQVKDALASTRKSGTIALGPWRTFLLGAKGFSPTIRIRASEIYLERAHASTGKAEKYLIGIMRGENDQTQFGLRPRAPGAATLQITPDAKAEHAVPGRKFL